MRKKLRGKGISNLGQGEECDSAVAFGDWGCWFWGAAGLSAQHRDRQAPTRASLSQPNLASPGTTYKIPISCCTPNKTRTQGTPLLHLLVPRSHAAFPQNRVPEGVRLSRGRQTLLERLAGEVFLSPKICLIMGPPGGKAPMHLEEVVKKETSGAFRCHHLPTVRKK